MTEPMHSPPFSVLRIDHIVLRVKDVERAIAFYRDVLGCEIEKRRDDLGLVHLRAGSSLIDLVTHEGPLGRQGGALAGKEGRNVDHFCLRIQPFDEAAIRALMAQHGVPVHGEVQNNFGAEGNGPSIYIADPDGNGVELKGPTGSSV
ncbi:catechol 2,3-dioxygenase-like lactoylglutathione lyase family enzyme [Variovorax paradoxus]|uniref:VOC family protein n=1 Tax=Variovorax paradoxus TaxID=34073 RepID=UPI00277EDAB3|nr:VOC family protein [Variovorax paradoxus]MDP9931886.1 catechol 2,3-dioxygenase-like lactoylglutathione lyase family enzyme [Variovorax paradoxus]MDQ0026084.1 catechol 2,3-dioxygenase-like lactoylglutathione lyase family enzyme [Variovorax paradoxus]